MNNCIFCGIYERNEKIIIFSSVFFFVIPDLLPASKGHLLVISKKHHDNLFSFSFEEGNDFFPFVQRVLKLLKKTFISKNFNLLLNNGGIAGQTVPHFHLHIIPKYKDKSGLFFSFNKKNHILSENSDLLSRQKKQEEMALILKKNLDINY